MAKQDFISFSTWLQEKFPDLNDGERSALLFDFQRANECAAAFEKTSDEAIEAKTPVTIADFVERWLLHESGRDGV